MKQWKKLIDMNLVRHTFCFNEHDNGGESLILTTNFFGNGNEDGFYTSQKLELSSYCNSASLNLCSVLTPQILRKLADELEAAETEAKNKINEILRGNDGNS